MMDVFGYGMLLCLLLAAISLFTPRTVAFFKAPTKVKGILFWIGMSAVCFAGFGLTSDPSKLPAKPAPTAATAQQTSPQPATAPVPVAAQAEQSPSLDLSLAPTPEDEKESAAARESMAKKSPPLQAELNKFYKELLAMRGTKDFVELGFSGNNKKAADWKKRVEAFRASIENDNDLPVQVRAAPAYMLTIGFAKEWRAGKDTADSKWDTQMILDGINWKLEE